MTEQKLEEYLRRNLLVATSCGVDAAIKKSIERVNNWKKQPKWLLATLEGAKTRMVPIMRELVDHRENAHLHPFKTVRAYPTIEAELLALIETLIRQDTRSTKARTEAVKLLTNFTEDEAND